MTESSEDYELFHYGVKGMKWGVRKDRGGSPGPLARRKARKQAEEQAEIRGRSQDHVKAQKLRSRNLSSLSNAEIQTLNKRLQLETDYARLMENTRTKGSIEKGLEFALGVNQKTDSVVKAYKSPTAKMIKKAFAKSN